MDGETRNERGQFLPGAVHHKWKGDSAIGPNTGRSRAQAKYRELGLCELCGERPARDRHHRDGNPLNNERENLELICRSCHNREHGRTPPRPDPAAVSRQFKGKTPWNKGLTKATAPNLKGGRTPRGNA